MELQKVKSCKDNTDLMRYRDLAGEVLLLLLLVLLLTAAPLGGRVDCHGIYIARTRS